jgi:hypothetical protein
MLGVSPLTSLVSISPGRSAARSGGHGDPLGSELSDAMVALFYAALRPRASGRVRIGG